MRTEEGTHEEYFRVEIMARRGFCWKMKPFVKGVPDRLVILPDISPCLVELKTVDGELEAIQKQIITELLAINAPVFIIKGREQIDGFLRMYDSGGQSTLQIREALRFVYNWEKELER